MEQTVDLPYVTPLRKPEGLFFKLTFLSTSDTTTRSLELRMSSKASAKSPYLGKGTSPTLLQIINKNSLSNTTEVLVGVEPLYNGTSEPLPQWNWSVLGSLLSYDAKIYIWNDNMKSYLYANQDENGRYFVDWTPDESLADTWTIKNAFFGQSSQEQRVGSDTPYNIFHKTTGLEIINYTPGYNAIRPNTNLSRVYLVKEKAPVYQNYPGILFHLVD